MANKIADVIDGFMPDFGSNDKEDIEPEPKKTVHRIGNIFIDLLIFTLYPFQIRIYQKSFIISIQN